MKTQVLVPSLVAGLAGIFAPLAAQTPAGLCDGDKTVVECYQILRPTGGDTAAARKSAESALQQRLQGKTVGPDLSSDGPLSSIFDFLPRAAAALIAPTSGAAPDLGFKINLPLNDGVLFATGLTGQISTVFREPTLAARIADSLSESAVTRTRGSLGAFDNAVVSGALNVENRRLGRTLRPHSDLIRSLAASFYEQNAEIAARTRAANHTWLVYVDNQTARLRRDAEGIIATGRVQDPRCRVQADGVEGVHDFGRVAISCLTPETRGETEQAIMAVVEAAQRSIDQHLERLRESGFTHLAQLANNQPQFNVNWEYDARRSLVGPSQWTGRARLEMGFANINGLRHSCNGDVSIVCLQRYLSNPAVRGSIARADRVFAQLDFTRRAKWHVWIPEDSFDIRLGSATSIALNAGYGAYVGNADQGENRDRLDLQGKYDFTRDDLLRQDRFVGTLFYTRRVSDNASALFGITWANRPEFLGDVTRKLGANIGFTYKLNNGDAQK
jgi:hypothetical protein